MSGAVPGVKFGLRVQTVLSPEFIPVPEVVQEQEPAGQTTATCPVLFGEPCPNFPVTLVLPCDEPAVKLFEIVV